MKPGNFLNHSLIALSLSIISVNLYSQEKVQNNEYQPEVGQEGKDVVWVPTPQALVEKMLNLAKITKEDFLIDLGSGDGRTVITAAKRGIHALGVEYNPDMVGLSRKNAEKEGVSDRAQFTKADLFEFDFSKATVITMFLLPDINLRLRPQLLDLKPGTRIVSNTFTMEEWQFDDTAKISGRDTRWNTAYLWIVPAKVEATWKLADGELTLTQQFQMISGTLKTGTKSVDISDGRLRGNEITFTAGNDVYTGTVDGNKIEGNVTSSGNIKKWSAAK
jgi:SAM-dependent methyltransferase